MYDLYRSSGEKAWEVPVLPGVDITAEGMVLVAVDGGDGTLNAQLSGGQLNEVFLGFSTFCTTIASKKAVCEDGNVPASGVYTFQLQHANIDTAQVRVRNMTSGSESDLTVVTTGNPTTGQVKIETTGLLTFNSAQASIPFRVWYKYTLTVPEALADDNLYTSGGFYTNNSKAILGTVGVLKGKGRIFTDQYDNTKVFAIGTTVTSGANGLCSVGGSGANIGFVIQVPTPDDPMLGVEF